MFSFCSYFGRLANLYRGVPWGCNLKVEKLILAFDTPEARIYEDGTVDVPSGPVIGVQISEKTLRRFTVAQQMVK